MAESLDITGAASAASAARGFPTGDTTADRWVRFAAERDPALREQLILQYAPLVKYVVGRLAIMLPRILDSDDVLSIGTMGLIEAVDRYDPSTGVKFQTYAISRVRGAILDELRSLDWIPRSARQRSADIAKTFARLEAETGQAPTDEEVARALGLDMHQYQQASLSASAVILSLETPVSGGDGGDGEGAPLVETIEATGTPTPADALEESEMLEGLAGAIGALSDRERTLLSLYYEQELTMKEISAVLEVSESRVCQLHSRALHRLRAHMSSLAAAA
ncbi:MAG TPA: FliA/WhiG family RNA polymerase sigma factor [Chloroflexota bacterium]|nr:FliA/WhiG family RNA polymerase sigma factor [Chloroflexota bacterium]